MNRDLLGEDKKERYEKVKSSIVRDLRSLIELLEESDDPISGERRRMFLQKFNILDRQMIDRLDTCSFEWFDELRTERKNQLN